MYLTHKHVRLLHWFRPSFSKNYKLVSIRPWATVLEFIAIVLTDAHRTSVLRGKSWFIFKKAFLFYRNKMCKLARGGTNNLCLTIIFWSFCHNDREKYKYNTTCFYLKIYKKILCTTFLGFFSSHFSNYSTVFPASLFCPIFFYRSKVE